MRRMNDGYFLYQDELIKYYNVELQYTLTNCAVGMLFIIKLVNSFTFRSAKKTGAISKSVSVFSYIEITTIVLIAFFMV